MNEFQKGNRCQGCYFLKSKIIDNGYYSLDFKCDFHKDEAEITHPKDQCCDRFYSKEAGERNEKINKLLNE